MNKPKIPIRREDLGPGENLCEYCTAKCCRYFALSIDPPRTEADFDFLRWYLLHDRASLFTEGETWYLLVHTTCKHLQGTYTTAECEFDDSYTYEQYFETPEQVEEYANARFSEPENFRSPRPKLQILA